MTFVYMCAKYKVLYCGYLMTFVSSYYTINIELIFVSAYTNLLLILSNFPGHWLNTDGTKKNNCQVSATKSCMARFSRGRFVEHLELTEKPDFAGRSGLIARPCHVHGLIYIYI